MQDSQRTPTHGLEHQRPVGWHHGTFLEGVPYNEAIHVPFHSHVGQIRHHMGHYFEAAVFGQLETLIHSPDSMSSIGISSHILFAQKKGVSSAAGGWEMKEATMHLIDRLHTYLKTCTTI